MTVLDSLNLDLAWCRRKEAEERAVVRETAAEVRVQEAQQQVLQVEQRAIELEKKNRALEGHLQEMKERYKNIESMARLYMYI